MALMDASIGADQPLSPTEGSTARTWSLSDFGDLDRVFAIKGEAMMVHAGRSVVRVDVEGRPHFLKRYWLTPLQVFRRFCAQGLHELAMIDWLNSRGFLGPEVVARGVGRRLGLRTRVFFLMRQAEGELPLERFARRNGDRVEVLIQALAGHTARLHDKGFYHTDYSERHIHVVALGEGFQFRQIDLERARVGRRDDGQAAADIKTLQCSIANERLADMIEGPFVEHYLSQRTTAPSAGEFRALLRRARPTKTFQ